MYLSKLEIIGFKSFAQRIDVNFDSGVTAIVGPNGCGKTNIVDAIRWALGEQRYSTLRSDKMEDVIFNGTKSRKPLGLAEVSLTIENTKGILPTEYSEVTITRRVFRSGESEYLLNKVPCRLKDILDLFMDTGMGSDAYSVIELKMVETILSDQADERRKLFEEAAGVTKYKFRRKAAIRKLESVQQDLTRVNDIVKEVQKTVNSLERQAKKAEQYNDSSGRLKALEIDLIEREFAYLSGKLAPLEERFGQAMTGRTKIDETLRSEEDRVEGLRSGLSGIEEDLRSKQQAVQRHSEAIHRIEEKILVANERLGSLASNVGRFEREIADFQTQQADLAEQILSLRKRMSVAHAELGTLGESFARAKTGQSELASALEAKKADVQSSKDALLTLAHTIVQKRGDQERIRARIDNLKGRVERSLEDNALYAADIESHTEQVVRLTAQDRELRKRFVEAEMQLYEKEKEKSGLKSEIDLLEKKLLEDRNEIERTGSKIDFLRRMVENNEGFAEGVRFLLASPDWKTKGISTVADLISVDDKYRTAIESALGETAHALVVGSVDEGHRAIAELTRGGKGKATFICLDWVPKLRRRRGGKPAQAGIEARTLVGCDDRYRPLIDFLLEGVLVVESIDAAPDILSLRAGVRCISLDGQRVTGHGELHGGSRRLDEGGLIGKKSQIAALEEQVLRLEERHRRHHEEAAGLRSRYDAFAVSAQKDAVKNVEKEMTAIEMRIAQLEFEKKRANDGVDRNRLEIENLEREIRDLERLHTEASGALARQEEMKLGQEASAASAMREMESLEVRWDEQTKLVNELEIRVVTLQNDERNFIRDIERAEERGAEITLSEGRRQEEIGRARQEIGRLEGEGESLTAQVNALRSELGQREQERLLVEQEYDARRNELHRIELKIKDERRLHDESVASAHDLEMKVAELKSGIEHLRQRAREEFELDVDLKVYPEDEWVDFAQLREEVRMLKERIRTLGAINFAAFDEFTTESERLAFLTQQRDDLLEAEKTLLDTIEEINLTAQRKFSDTFAKIRENFIRTFKELFQAGDECDLRIEEGVDPLEANIEIIAKPRGKRPTSIDLLSGGEKTLTAIALLFAIYLVKPSPFCILDEVDAPLDDSNIDRFTRILRKFSDNTQFIVVTHNKRTMEAASALYGVTMEEEGVSKIVTVRFNEEARVRSAAVAG